MQPWSEMGAKHFFSLFLGALVGCTAISDVDRTRIPPDETASHAPGFTLARGDFSLDVSQTGHIVDLHERGGRSWYRPGSDNVVRVGVGNGDLIACDTPSSIGADGAQVVMEFDLTPRVPLHVREVLRLVDADGAVALQRIVSVVPTAPPIRDDVRVSVSDGLSVPGAAPLLFVPHQAGMGETAPAGDRRFLFALSGSGLDTDAAARLAIPMVSESDADGDRLTRAADVEFSTSFAPGRRGWMYKGHDVPLAATESRVLYDVFHHGSPDAAMKAFYATALADVPPGPSWLHDIAWQHYDYMSHGGRGWFADIDAVAAAVAPEDRAKILFTLHGWIDVYGHYTFDWPSRRLLDSWTVFPKETAVAAQFPGLETMPMSRAEVHRRLAYPKSLGFRVALYFADGMATGEDVADLFRPERTLYKGGWQGPDTTSPTWILNPGHPAVAQFFRDYTDALLAEYGNEIDALVWDETFHVRVGMVGPAASPSYADRAMMRLTRDLTKRVTAFRPELAFLTSDVIRAVPNGVTSDVPPYALMGHGTYQESGSQPQDWKFGLFPNYRNTLWSCNWQAESHFAYTKYGVETFGTPVATTNGFGDNIGVAALEQASSDRIFALFAERKARGRQIITWLPSP